ncbi:dTDP-4-dehydrorhamnose 3,5-epimerase family protein [Deinococcus sedimenti]|uniref:LPS biosynthesis protein n=1 Tax=Deinococcus sedimenti TaxID=1867090 RepID=A0ABQ2S6B3_9DEIO|nr:dTDP-4-dehydrorhamnose 3,5-epimerase family protein [Deinococcus sedimenti]GGR93396.1 LPS biosynthesis protein [Deinococcus sedimenti]
MTRLREEVQLALSFQSYAPGPGIAGVQVVPLRKYRGENGAFAEILRLEEGRLDGLPDFTPRQLSVSWGDPGRVNAFHLHPRQPQNELWCVLTGQLLVWLVDVRADSVSSGVRRAVILSSEAPSLLLIPSGVAHGYRAGAQGATLLYAMDAQFNPDDPNEGRLPWDHFGADLWAEDRG